MGAGGPSKQVPRVNTQRGVYGYGDCPLEVPKRPKFRCMAAWRADGAPAHTTIFNALLQHHH
eukprot:scaffold17218_cov29-Tisochrysis_lutea.AAC.2